MFAGMQPSINLAAGSWGNPRRICRAGGMQNSQIIRWSSAGRLLKKHFWSGETRASDMMGEYGEDIVAGLLPVLVFSRRCRRKLSFLRKQLKYVTDWLRRCTLECWCWVSWVLT